MKNIIKNNILGFTLGLMVCTGIVYAANYKASEIEYSSDKTGETNVEGAINELYKVNDDLVNLKSKGNATPEDIVTGKTAIVQGEEITGTAQPASENVNSVSFSLSAYATDDPNYWQAQLNGFDCSKFNKMTTGSLSGADAHNSSGVIYITAVNKSGTSVKFESGTTNSNKTYDISNYNSISIVLQGRYAKSMSIPITFSK